MPFDKDINAYRNAGRKGQQGDKTSRDFANDFGDELRHATSLMLEDERDQKSFDRLEDLTEEGVYDIVVGVSCPVDYQPAAYVVQNAYQQEQVITIMLKLDGEPKSVSGHLQNLTEVDHLQQFQLVDRHGRVFDVVLNHLNGNASNITLVVGIDA